MNSHLSLSYKWVRGIEGGTRIHWFRVDEYGTQTEIKGGSIKDNVKQLLLVCPWAAVSFVVQGGIEAVSSTHRLYQLSQSVGTNTQLTHDAAASCIGCLEAHRGQLKADRRLFLSLPMPLTLLD